MRDYTTQTDGTGMVTVKWGEEQETYVPHNGVLSIFVSYNGHTGTIAEPVTTALEQIPAGKNAEEQRAMHIPCTKETIEGLVIKQMDLAIARGKEVEAETGTPWGEWLNIYRLQ